MRRSLIEWLGLLGVISFLSYIVAVIFAPLAYPNYDWMTQAVSDLSAVNAPSRILWQQLSALYNVCAIVSITLVSVYIKDKLNKKLRVGIYIFTVMSWISSIGYNVFPLSSSGNAGSFQDIIHIYVITTLVVLLSIISLIVIMVGGYTEKQYRYIAVSATIVLITMFTGAIGAGIVPKEYFGIFERFTVFAVTGFNAILGICLFFGFPKKFCKIKIIL